MALLDHQAMSESEPRVIHKSVYRALLNSLQQLDLALLLRQITPKNQAGYARD
jgi:hypothetical protein